MSFNKVNIATRPAGPIVTPNSLKGTSLSLKPALPQFESKAVGDFFRDNMALIIDDKSRIIELIQFKDTAALLFPQAKKDLETLNKLVREAEHKAFEKPAASKPSAPPLFGKTLPKLFGLTKPAPKPTQSLPPSQFPKQPSTAPKTTQSLSSIPNAASMPQGIFNHRNDCFIISLFQMIAHTPELNAFAQTIPTIKPLIQKHLTGGNVDSQELRKAFNALLFPHEKKALDSQEDMGVYLIKFLELAGQSSLAPVFPGFYNTLGDMATYLHSVREEHTAPQNLPVQFSRQSTEGFDSSYSPIPMGFEYNDALYELSYASVFRGSDNKGHYVSLVKKRGQWFEINDRRTTPISATQVEREITTAGCILNYEKICDIENEKPKENPIPEAPDIQEMKNQKPYRIPRAPTPKTAAATTLPTLLSPQLAPTQPTAQKPAPSPSFIERSFCYAIPVVALLALNVLGFI